MESVLQGFDVVIAFFDTGIYDYLEGALERVTAWLIVWYIEIKIYALTFSWSVASLILQNIGLTDLINDMWAGLDSELLAFITYLKIPDCINMLLSAYTTRFVMGLM